MEAWTEAGEWENCKAKRLTENEMEEKGCRLGGKKGEESDV